MKPLDEFKDAISKSAFGMTKAEARKTSICVQCKEPALAKCYSDAGRREYAISGLCEQCFDSICGEDEDE